MRDNPECVTPTMSPDPHNTQRRLGRILGLFHRPEAHGQLTSAHMRRD